MKRTEMDKNGQNKAETFRIGQKQEETEKLHKNKQKWR